MCEGLGLSLLRDESIERAGDQNGEGEERNKELGKVKDRQERRGEEGGKEEEAGRKGESQGKGTGGRRKNRWAEGEDSKARAAVCKAWRLELVNITINKPIGAGEERREE